MNPNITAGRYTYDLKKIEVVWLEPSKMRIGNFCCISDIRVFLGGNHRTDWVTTFPFGHINLETFSTFNGVGHPKTNGNIMVGNDAYLCHGATILSGITIGDGAVVAAGSVVVKDVPPYAIVGGNPAKLIKYRFTPEQITELLKIKWWNWPDEKINEECRMLCCPDIDAFIARHLVS